MFKKITDFVFFISLFEIFIGGGGNFFKYNGISIRMIFFGLNFLFFLTYILKGAKFNYKLLFITLFFLILHIFSVIIGVYNNAPSEYIMINFQATLIFILLPYYAFKINSINKVEDIIRLIKKSSIILVIFHITFMYVLLIKILNFNYLYSFVSKNQDIKFRDEQFFFYSGFIYICIGLFIFLTNKGLKNRVLTILLFTSILLTLTRGFIFFTSIVIAFYYLVLSKKYSSKIYLIFLGVLFVTIFLPFLIENRTEKSMYISDEVRIQTNKEIVETTDFSSIFLGHGFGVSVPVRPIGLENSFLDIFYKQGIIGIAFWISLFCYITYLTYSVKDSIYYNKIIIFWLGTFFLYLQSLSNPYINTAIGIPFLLISISALLTIKQSIK
jgi:hypothetical protein